MDPFSGVSQKVPIALSSLPIVPVLPELFAALDNHASVILQAPPGAGKSTLLPLELVRQHRLPGRIIMLEPRRLAARNIASFLARQLGEKVGERIGLRVRGESRTSSQTRLEIVTEGVLTRMLQQDPELTGVSLVIFDEFHERSLHADTALAFAIESQQGLRDDLKLLVMSATLDGMALDRLLLMCTEIKGPSAEVFSRYPRLPMVMMDWSPFAFGGDVIQDNSFLGGEIATNHLIENGFTRIACIAGPLDKSLAKSRLDGFYRAMAQAGLDVPPEYVLESDFEFSGGFSAMNQLLSLPVPPQAVFAGNDAMAVGAYQAIWQKGLRIPQDIAVIGYDDIDLAAFLTPPLTTIHQPKDELGKLAVDKLLRRMDDADAPSDLLVLTPALINRGSVICG